ncbi:MAG: M4 family metallopeptidase, partial [Gammaproteobacteria bacterium]|nr:M4 family metallopeptidase [Gammaproteobacteria bacterium]
MIKTIQQGVLVLLCTGVSAYSLEVHAATAEQKALASHLTQQGAQVSFAKSGVTRFIGSKSQKPLSVSGTSIIKSPDVNAFEIIKQYAPIFGVRDAVTQLSIAKQSTQPGGRNMVRFQQYHNGVPVIGGELLVNMDGQAKLLSMSGEASPVNNLDVLATISQQEAEASAMAAVAKWYALNPMSLHTGQVNLAVYDPNLITGHGGAIELVWKLNIIAEGSVPVNELLLVNASTGVITLHFNQVHSLKSRQTYNSLGSDGSYDNLPGSLVCEESSGDACTSGVSIDADQAHQYAGDTYDYFFTNHQRDGIDGVGGALVSSVNYCTDVVNCPYVNAFWRGDIAQVVYGAGVITDDIAGHELTHGVTESTSQLFYYYQAGAIAESLSDVWGEFIDLTNSSIGDVPADRWYIGEDMADGVYGLGVYRGAIRSMSDPTLFSTPDKMSSPFYYTEDLDRGGVHVNGGVNNKAVFLMTDGGVFNGHTISGIGIAKVSSIYYEAQTSLLTSGANYGDLFLAVNQACQNLVGDISGIVASDCIEVNKALLAVE